MEEMNKGNWTEKQLAGKGKGGISFSQLNKDIQQRIKYNPDNLIVTHEINKTIY